MEKEKPIVIKIHGLTDEELIEFKIKCIRNNVSMREMIKKFILQIAEEV